MAKPFTLTLNLHISAEQAEHLEFWHCDNYDWWTQFSLNFCQAVGPCQAEKVALCADVIILKETFAEEPNFSVHFRTPRHAPATSAPRHPHTGSPSSMSTPGAPDPSRAAGHALEAWEMEEPSSYPGGTSLLPAGFQAQAVPQTKTSSVYIALAGDTNHEILDMKYFGTHGYVPAWICMDNAVAALEKHLYGTTTPTEYKYMVYHFEIVEGKLYMRPDKMDSRMRKLFFPLPMHNAVTEFRMQQVWKREYMNTARWRQRYDWDCTFMDCIRVRKVTCGTLELDATSGRFKPR